MGRGRWRRAVRQAGGARKQATSLILVGCWSWLGGSERESGLGQPLCHREAGAAARLTMPQCAPAPACPAQPRRRAVPQRGRADGRGGVRQGQPGPALPHGRRPNLPGAGGVGGWGKTGLGDWAGGWLGGREGGRAGGRVGMGVGGAGLARGAGRRTRLGERRVAWIRAGRRVAPAPSPPELRAAAEAPSRKRPGALSAPARPAAQHICTLPPPLPLPAPRPPPRAQTGSPPRAARALHPAAVHQGGGVCAGGGRLLHVRLLRAPQVQRRRQDAGVQPRFAGGDWRVRG